MVENRRILVVDDTPSIHDDFQKVLSQPNRAIGLAELEQSLFGSVGDSGATRISFEVDHAYQGQEGVDKVIAAYGAGRPYALVFMDVRMPPGMDGIEAASRVFQAAPDTEVVICTAFSDYSRDATIARVGRARRFLFLRKPYDAVEVCQLATTLTTKWNSAKNARKTLVHLELEAQRAAEALVEERAKGQQIVKLAALGQMADGISREFRSPLAEIDRIADWINANVKDVRPLPIKALGDASRDLEVVAGRMAKLVASLRDFSRDASRDPTRAVPLDQLLSDTLTLCAERMRTRGIQVTVANAGSVLVECRPVQIAQVILSLLNNAYDAVQALKEKWIEIRVVDRTTTIALEVIDSGRGLPPDIARHAFNPYFTTKVDGGHPGLGLSIAREIAEHHAGHLTYRVENGHTAFILEIPKLAPMRATG